MQWSFPVFHIEKQLFIQTVTFMNRNVEEFSVSYKERDNNLQIQNADKGYAIIFGMANR